MAIVVNSRLTSNFVHDVLETEKKLLENSLERWVECCCIPCTDVKNWTPQHMQTLKFRTRLIVRCAAPLIVYSILITIITATVLTAERTQEEVFFHDTLDYIPAIIAGTFMSFYFIMHSLLLLCKADECLIPRQLYSSLLAAQIKGDIKKITRHQSQIAEKVDLIELARLMVSASLSVSGRNEILEKANVLEFKTMLKELTFLGAPIQLSEGLQSLRQLIENPPVEPIKYREMILRVINTLVTEDDFREISLSLPADDPRRQILPRSIELEDAESAESSSSPDFIAIDIPPRDTIPIAIGDLSIQIDKELLCQKSSWFATFFKQDYPLSDEPVYKEVLIEVLQNLDSIPSLWRPIKREKKDEYLKLFDCLHYYDFIDELHALTIDMVTNHILSSDEKFQSITYVITSVNASDRMQEHWWNFCFAELKDARSMVGSHTHFDTLAFTLKFFKKKTIALYTEYLSTVTDYYSPTTIRGIVKYQEKLPKAERVIAKAVGKQLVNRTFEAKEYESDAHFLEWFGRFLQESEDNLINIFNFKTLWPLSSYNQRIKDTLIKFSAKNQLAVIRLWSIGEVPADLMDAIPY